MFWFYDLFILYVKDNAFSVVKRNETFLSRFVKGVPFVNGRHTGYHFREK